MKLLIILGIFSISVQSQVNLLNCDSLIYEEHRGCLFVEIMPALIGGLDSLQSRLIYPKHAKESNIEGKVYVWVMIDSTGNQFCATIIKSLGYGCDEEALRLVTSSKFEPGILRQKPYAMPISIPVVFSLSDDW